MFKFPFGQNDNANVDFNKIKKSNVTADGIISQAVKDSGNISSITLSKEEQLALLKQRKHMPFHILLLKFISLIAFSGLLGISIFIKADIDLENKYLSLLGAQENTGWRYKQKKTELDAKQAKIDALTTGITAKQTRLDQKKYGEHSTQIEELQKMQKNWFTTTETPPSEISPIPLTEEENQKEKTEKEDSSKITYGVLDSLEEMITFFEDANYQTKYFAKKEKEQLGASFDECKNPFVSVVRKATLKCPKSFPMLVMRNEIEITGTNVSPEGAKVNLRVSEILSKVFTLGTEFVDMMNSFPFYKNAEIKSFNRQTASNGEESMDLVLDLQTQNIGDADPADEFFQYFEDWKRVNSAINDSLTTLENAGTKTSVAPQVRK